jgi:DNA-binding XRE family transcriptional regulator
MSDTIIVTRAEYEALLRRVAELEADEDRRDARKLTGELERIEVGEEEALPIEMVKRLIAGEHPIRVWREHRGMTGLWLAEHAGVSRTYLSEIEHGEKPGSVKALAAIARVLGVTLDDLIAAD